MTTLNLNPLEGDVTLAEVAAALGTLGAGGFGGALTNNWFRRRREKADVLEQVEGILVREAERALASASRRAEEAERRADARVDEVERKLAEHQRTGSEYRQRQRAAAALHTAWDDELVAKLRAQGIDVPAPPPLEIA